MSATLRLTLLAALLPVAALRAQEPQTQQQLVDQLLSSSLGIRTSMADAPLLSPTTDIQQVGCDGCGAGKLPPRVEPPLFPGGGQIDAAGCTGCCGGAGCGQCIPGRTHACSDCEATTTFGRFACCLYKCVCCPDPCYEGKWYPVADNAFFVEAVRPVTQTRFRWDSAHNILFPDRSEYLWARADGNGLGPKPKAPFRGETKLRYNDLTMVTEGGNGVISVIAETNYRNQKGDIFGQSAGFTDLVFGTKTLLFDCELLQVSTMFKTYVPSGSVTKGLGTGHVSLEPSILVGLKLATDEKLRPQTYFQGQISQFIPLGGDPAYAGGILHYHAAVNHVICYVLPDCPIVGSVEANGWSFQDGAYTDPILGGLQKSSGTTYVTAGGGLRLHICDRCDMGAGAAFAVTKQHFAQDFLRMEFRYRY